MAYSSHSAPVTRLTGPPYRLVVVGVGIDATGGTVCFVDSAGRRIVLDAASGSTIAVSRSDMAFPPTSRFWRIDSSCITGIVVGQKSVAAVKLGTPPDTRSSTVWSIQMSSTPQIEASTDGLFFATPRATYYSNKPGSLAAKAYRGASGQVACLEGALLCAYPSYPSNLLTYVDSSLSEKTINDSEVRWVRANADYFVVGARSRIRLLRGAEGASIQVTRTSTLVPFRLGMDEVSVGPGYVAFAGVSIEGRTMLAVARLPDLTLAWSRHMQSGLAILEASAERILVSEASTAALSSLNPNSGDTLWALPRINTPMGLFRMKNRTIVQGNDYLLSLSPSGGLAWRILTPHGVLAAQ